MIAIVRWYGYQSYRRIDVKYLTTDTKQEQRFHKVSTKQEQRFHKVSTTTSIPSLTLAVSLGMFSLTSLSPLSHSFNLARQLHVSREVQRV